MNHLNVRSVDLLYGLTHPQLAYHGSLSLTVNFASLREYFSRNGCFQCTTPQSSQLDIAICCYGFENSSLPSLFDTFEYGFNAIHIYDIYVLRDHLEDCTIIPLSTIFYLLRIAAWDYDILFQFESYILKYLSESFEVSSILLFQEIMDHSSRIYLTCHSPGDHERLTTLLQKIEIRLTTCK